MTHFFRNLSERMAAASRAVPLSSFIPYSCTAADGVLLSRDGMLFATWRLAGVPAETAGDASLSLSAASLNLLYRSLPAGACVTVHRVRREVTERLTLPPSGFPRRFASEYEKHFEKRPLMKTELYFTLGLPLIARKSGREILEASLSVFRESADAAERSLARFHPVRLREYRKNGVRFSRQLEFFSFLLTGRSDPVRVPCVPLYEALGSASLFFSADAGEISGSAGRTYFAALEVKDFMQATEPGILDGLLYPDSAMGRPPFPFIETHIFRPLTKRDGAHFLKLQRKHLEASGDAAFSQAEELAAAADRLAAGDFVLGEYSASLIVFGKTEAEARRNTLDAAEKLRDAGMLPVVSSLALPALFFSALPGNADAAPRIARITSLNFAHLAPFHGNLTGKRTGNPWGEALLLLRTPSDHPYFFSFHATPEGEDSSGKTALANTAVIGTSGTGKTVFLNACAAFAQKFRTPESPLTLVFFDKDRGAEAAVRSIPGSVYVRLKRGRPTGFNPFSLPPTPENISFLVTLVTGILETAGDRLTPSETARTAEAVRSVMELPKSERRLSAVPLTLAASRNEEAAENPLSLRLSRWIGSGDLAWVFDCETDTLDLDSHAAVGIDGTEFLADAAVASAVAAYLLKRVTDALDGRRFLLFIDEFWMWLRSPQFSSFTSDRLKTIRKLNGAAVLATQSPADVLSSAASRDIVEQCPTQVFFPNPRALPSDYIEGFRLTPEEFSAVQALPESSHAMLIRQSGKSTVARLDLTGLADALAVFSGNAKNLALLDEIEAAEEASPVRPAFTEKELDTWLERVKRSS